MFTWYLNPDLTNRCELSFSPRPLLFTHLHLDIRRDLFLLLWSHEARLTGTCVETEQNKTKKKYRTNLVRTRTISDIQESPGCLLTPHHMAGLHCDGWRLRQPSVSVYATCWKRAKRPCPTAGRWRPPSSLTGLLSLFLPATFYWQWFHRFNGLNQKRSGTGGGGAGFLLRDKKMFCRYLLTVTTGNTTRKRLLTWQLFSFRLSLCSFSILVTG